ncbi:dicarboxylate transporter 2.1, chloroplastic-like isoform X2 [Humulus lupulus]|uniref:dicarboxylate transporter 2.1, chloroplastic-like isoform X2 n=1 Tax=Humulus lupulus TaxID=3486 RepID=UPI002B40FEF1|nr:dicarboxylate transporter 2.1, chloroplastic-like isoform X2 [Humulus lupulus]
MTWFKVASVPAIVSLLVSPLVLYIIYPPETKDIPEAPAMAAKKLESMGAVTKNQWIMIGTMLLAVSLWVFGETIGIPSVVAAMIGLSILLLTGVLDWSDCLNEKSAWDTLIGLPFSDAYWLTLSGFIIFLALIWVLQEMTTVRILRFVILFIDIYDDLISRRVNSSDAEKFAEICPCCNGVGWGVIWGMISFTFLCGSMYLGLVILS